MDLSTLLESPEWKFSSSNTKVLLDTDPALATETLRWNAYHAPTYKAAIFPGTEEDAQKAIQLAISNKVPFLVSSGGRHGYTTTLGELQGGLSIDLRQLDSIEIDEAANTVKVGGGVIVSKLADALYAAGKEIPVGVCSEVGYLGFVLGGGIGRYLGLHGLGIDSLLSVRMVTGTGQIVTASASVNSDLFWGMRGAGFNFGGVTSATFKIYPLSNGGQAQNADLYYAGTQAADVFRAVQKIKDDGQPQALVVLPFIAFSQEAGGAMLIINMTYFGAEEEFKAIVQPFLHIRPQMQVLGTIPSNRVTQEAVSGIDAKMKLKGAKHSIFGANLRKIEAETWIGVFEKIDAFYKATPAGVISGFVLELYSSEGMKKVADEETAWPCRDVEGFALLEVAWLDPSAEDACNTFCRELRQFIAQNSGYDGLKTYVSYAHGEETLEEKYGTKKLENLRVLKQKYDPNNMFGWNNSIQ
ncbi:hypothetical protein B0H66DRAFT_307121 [Apodospora peruviana]|uniref:FAD-binding PCMH-type domain-containing protein n=1 Tax=Apodospora peruviana TaxID=516989 RepID=A0AAE0I264_9PEZI|nr:hypothetical protein B0H66DRAFT_307121 [Apodospora peruviana]